MGNDGQRRNVVIKAAAIVVMCFILFGCFLLLIDFAVEHFGR